jgi:26S proteasome non-ATPase regulatory subunit 9|eukprot:COSAG06_NODE_26721_length_608_cov_1.220039_1_plen_75_part_00
MTSSSREDARTQLRALGQQRKSIEEEMEALTETLSTTGAGVNGKLVDAEGFPRADIDVHQTLIHRNRMAGKVAS